MAAPLVPIHPFGIPALECACHQSTRDINRDLHTPQLTPFVCNFPPVDSTNIVRLITQQDVADTIAEFKKKFNVK